MKKLAIACALAMPALSLADEVGHWYVAPHAGGAAVDNRRPTEDKDWLYGLRLGKHLSDNWSLEGNFDRARLEASPGTGDLRLHSGSLDLLRVGNRGGVVSPYLSVGVGALRSEFDPAGVEDDDFMGQAGVGLFVRLWSSEDGARTFSLRPDVKVRWSDAGGNTMRDYVSSLGFQYSFGQPEVRTAAVAPVAPPPAEPKAPPPAPPAPPADSDRDGVLDDRDQCPDTPAGVAVDEAGCPRRGSITLEGVGFELNSATLTTGARTALDVVAQDLRKYPRLRIELQGHTDSAGADEYNQRLSQKRAEAVRDFLVASGVAAEQLQARGYGESQPIDTNVTSEGRARNRRVVMSVLENPGDVQVEQAAESR